MGKLSNLLRWGVGILAIAALLAAACLETLDRSERRAEAPAWQEIRQ